MDAIGKVVLKVVNEWTDSPQPSEMSLVAKPEIRLPTTAEEARALAAWAETPEPLPELATIQEISRHLAFIAATLPSRSQDEEGGKMRVAVYSRILGEFTNHALTFMARRACETLDWFPTPRQCLDILREYRQPNTERSHARALLHQFAQQQFEAFMERLREREASMTEIDAVPDQWRRIAVERGYLRYAKSGGYEIRHEPRAVSDAA